MISKVAPHSVSKHDITHCFVVYAHQPGRHTGSVLAQKQIGPPSTYESSTVRLGQFEIGAGPLTLD